MHPVLRLFALAVAGLGFLFALLLSIAHAHDGHKIIHSQYGVQAPEYKTQGEIRGDVSKFLHGRRIGTGLFINCCLLYGNGDCQIKKLENVKLVRGGYEVDGEFISEADTNASPDDNYYACKHTGMATHCFFAPPQGF